MINTCETVPVDAMDESRFQDLYYSNLRDVLPGKTREQRERLLVGYLETDDIPKFLDRYEKGGEWIKDFGPLGVIEAIQALSVLTTNNELRRLRDRPASTGEIERKLEIEHPKGKTESLLKPCLLPRILLPTTSYDDKWEEEPDLEKLEADRGLDPKRGDVSIDERCCLPRGTVVTLNTPSMSALCMPIGMIAHPNDIVPTFVVVAFLETHTFGILYDYRFEDLDENPNAHLPENRCACFPGTDVQVSVGILEGLFTDKVVRLSGIQTDGYWIKTPLRLGDAIEKDWY